MILRNTIETIISSLSKRIDKLETGGKPIVGLSGRGGASLTLGAGVEATGIASTLTWSDPTVIVNPDGKPYIAVYVDHDNDSAYLWPAGVSLSSGQLKARVGAFLDGDDLANNNNRTRVRITLKNEDSTSHTYYIYVQWVYTKASSGGQ